MVCMANDREGLYRPTGGDLGARRTSRRGKERPRDKRGQTYKEVDKSVLWLDCFLPWFPQQKPSQRHTSPGCPSSTWALPYRRIAQKAQSGGFSLRIHGTFGFMQARGTPESIRERQCLGGVLWGGHAIRLPQISCH